MTLPDRFVVVAPSTSDNSLGRALSLATTAARLGPVEVLAFDTGAPWVGAGSWSYPVDGVAGLGPFAREVERRAAGGGATALISVKPLPTSLGVAGRVERRLQRAGVTVRLIADLDEDDLELRRESLRGVARRRRPAEHARLWREKLPGHPWRVRYLMKTRLRQAELTTVSSAALGDAVLPAAMPRCVLPHAREAQPLLPTEDTPRLRLGFFGTARSYKGVATLAEILRVRDGTELHLLGDEPPGDLPGDVRDRVVLHPQRGSETLRAGYEAIDVVLLPQAAGSRQTALQLPAKLVDAMVFGRPVIATDTAPIREIGGDAVLLVEDWEPLGAALAHLDRLRDPIERKRLGAAAHARAERTLTSDVLSRRLAEALDGGAGTGTGTPGTA